MVKKQVPGPKGRQTFYYLSRIRKVGILEALVELWHDFGDWVRVPTVFGKGLFFVYNPADVQSILVKEAKKFIKGKAVEPFKLLVGNGLSVTEHEVWLGQRRLVQPSFHMKALESYVPTMVNTTSEHRKLWLSHKGDDQNQANDFVAFDFNKAFSQLTHDIVARTLLGFDLGPRLAVLQSSWSVSLTFIVQRANKIVKFPLWFPFPSHLEFHRAIKIVNDTVDEIVQLEIAKGSSPHTITLLSRMLAARNSELSNLKLSDRDIRDQILNFLFAGHETTANCLSWTLYLLLKNPRVKEKLLLEIDTLLADRPATFKDLSELNYLRQVIFESLRVYPPVSMFVREALQDVELSGCTLPQGATIIISPFVMHRRSDLWKDAETFYPERFDDPATNVSPPAFLAFGAGGRACVGDNFAVNELMLVMADLLQNVDFEIEPDLKVDLFFNGTLRPEPFVGKIRARSRLPSLARL